MPSEDSNKDKKESDAHSDKFMLVSLEDEKSKHVAEVLSSKTCKRIIGYLAEVSKGGASQKDISSALGIPMNTMDYNMKKLIASGFVQKRKNFFWSKKGKKIVMYELSNKSILISPGKSSSTSEKFRSLVPAFIITAAGTFAAWVYQKVVISPKNEAVNYVSQKGTEAMLASGAAPSIAGNVGVASQNITPAMIETANLGAGTGMFSMPIWGWFLLGALIGIFIISVVNWRKL